MMLEPAQRAGDAPRSASEQGASPESPSPPAPAEPVTRLSAPSKEARLRTEREQWWLRRSLERQLHDGASLRISALTLQLGLLRHRAAKAECDLQDFIDGFQDELHAVLQELRDVSSKIYPPLLDEAGLGPALREAAERLDAPVRVNASEDRFGPAAEGAAYFAVVGCLEALPPGAECVDVVVRREDDTLAVDVGGAEAWHADAMLGAVRPLDGAIDITSGQRAATITMRIPCE
ncbi:histidine kinase dimerization/phosphoacceptor domain-containing protein [Pseudonocardia sp. DSM 110487]|jgi:Histidine kinase|uniref:sensor histidine kinase n=1 Tax=Pseudonocardia sp. DSM 110487 TaxID=2865833 RepID=UPI001C69CB5C|nr:histidine kinase dimerization/phosphoacceptor domain-containing protein [Pseudonocardia sp. DSM 110487]QYN34417.1 histidine kinase dimerization/phosphoacceptor domain-containing protein [Pseudonocardia sp. DSM 110487]